MAADLASPKYSPFTFTDTRVILYGDQTRILKKMEDNFFLVNTTTFAAYHIIILNLMIKQRDSLTLWSEQTESYMDMEQ